MPRPCSHLELEGDLLPGFIDLQVNGGGGVLFNDQPTVEGIAAIAAPTAGSAPPAAADADQRRSRRGRPGDRRRRRRDRKPACPVCSASTSKVRSSTRRRKGIHDASKFRTLDETAIDLLSSLRNGRTLVTLAPERAPPGAIRALTSAASSSRPAIPTPLTRRRAAASTKASAASPTFTTR
jgi:N-acetylglucosamine-6-phosphate deacetylase